MTNPILTAYKSLLFAPLVPGVVFSVLMLNPVVLLFAIPLGYVAMLIFGIPLYLLVCHFWRISLVSSVLVGGLSGIFVGLVFVWFGGGLELSVWFLKGLALFMVFGVISGAAFWWLYPAQIG